MKQIISIVLMIAIMALCFTACGGGNEQDKALAVKLAEEEAEEYYYDYLHGRSVGTGEYTGCDVSISETKYSGGKYQVTVALKITAVEGTYGIPVRTTQNIKYTIQVSNGYASVTNTEFLD